MLKIGLTGGIGVGKTTVSNAFSKLGVPIIDTDLIAHELVKPGFPAHLEIAEAFGESILNPDRCLDRSKLRELVFSNPEKKTMLELILHPKVRQRVRDELKTLQTVYCIVVVPLLIETDFSRLIDRVLVVDAPDSRRIPWIKNRSGLSESEIKKIIRTQTTREKRLEYADDVIDNQGSVAQLETIVSELHQKYLSLADFY